METPYFDQSGEIVWTSPIVEVGDFSLTYENTRLRFFGDRWAKLNHVEHRDPNGKLAGLTVTVELFDTLMELEFPYQFDPYPDPETQEWWVNLQNKVLQSDLKAFEHGDK